MFFLSYKEEEGKYGICSGKKGQMEWAGCSPAKGRAGGT